MCPEDNQLISIALSRFGISYDSANDRSVSLSTFGIHGDRHYRITCDDNVYSLRLLADDRYRSETHLASASDLNQQLLVTDRMREHGLPFMKRVQPTTDSSTFSTIQDDTGREWHCVLFDWIDGTHVTAQTNSSASKIGALLRQLHDIPVDLQFSFPVVDHTVAYRKWLHDLSKEDTTIASIDQQNLSNYLDLVQFHIYQAQRRSKNDLSPVLSTDLNPLNILWKNDHIVGIVDHEHISYSDRIQDLAWILKWYARNEGIHSFNVSPELAQTILENYDMKCFNHDDFVRLESLLWLSGCFNFHFVQQTFKLLSDSIVSSEELSNHLERYRQRGKALISLLAR
ncbi:phosphotransferase enzyme family protein [Exiguobacterium acetylicum]|uniref:phosphotransferase enzyme family protein n=1 Tax=Exiguobacterium acetylicum TaxID=41170 RepID=UPI001EE31762|nr:phosphotransferase [Exiguobacterium acetylicum]UKS54715.1 phosphotransferase [Exiguobacterium acetylicum]